jgi:hypothetical protein
MLSIGEDITDTALWQYRRSQFLRLLADMAAKRWSQSGTPSRSSQGPSPAGCSEPACTGREWTPEGSSTSALSQAPLSAGPSVN